MGSCFGRCTSKDTHAATTSCLWRRQATDEQEAELMSNASEKYKRENLIFRIIKYKRKQKRPEFIDKFWEHQDLNYAKLTTNSNASDNLSDIQLQNLDVNNFFSNTTTHAKESVINATTAGCGMHIVAGSRASSSLDLEWEHEYVHVQNPAFSPYCAQHCGAATHQQRQLINNNNNTTDDDDHYDNHTNLNAAESWQFLSNDEDQLNSITSMQSLSLSAQHAPAGACAAATTMQEQCTRRSVTVKGVHAKQNGGAAGGMRGGSFTRTSSAPNSWSHISTPESLEWDQDEEQQRQMRVEDDNLGYETLELLHQIEQLKNQVLNETGDGLLYESRGGDRGVNGRADICGENDEFINIS